MHIIHLRNSLNNYLLSPQKTDSYLNQTLFISIYEVFVENDSEACINKRQNVACISQYIKKVCKEIVLTSKSHNYPCHNYLIYQVCTPAVHGFFNMVGWVNGWIAVYVQIYCDIFINRLFIKYIIELSLVNNNAFNLLKNTCNKQ